VGIKFSTLNFINKGVFMGFYKFSLDKELGEQAEYHLLTRIQIIYKNAYKILEKESKYDIVIPEINKTLEVKNDLMSYKTKNIAIEIYRNNKNNVDLSGINISEADAWVIYALNKIFFMPKNDLKNFAIDNKNNFKTIYGGDNKRTLMIIIPIKILEQQNFVYEIQEE
jgi:hypothetical protein